MKPLKPYQSTLSHPLGPLAPWPKRGKAAKTWGRFFIVWFALWSLLKAWKLVQAWKLEETGGCYAPSGNVEHALWFIGQSWTIFHICCLLRVQLLSIAIGKVPEADCCTSKMEKLNIWKSCDKHHRRGFSTLSWNSLEAPPVQPSTSWKS